MYLFLGQVGPHTLLCFRNQALAVHGPSQGWLLGLCQDRGWVPAPDGRDDQRPELELVRHEGDEPDGERQDDDDDIDPNPQRRDPDSNRDLHVHEGPDDHDASDDAEQLQARADRHRLKKKLEDKKNQENIIERNPEENLSRNLSK